MRNNFKPRHLQKANERLDYHVLAFENIGEKKKYLEKKSQTHSFLKKFLMWFIPKK